MADQEQRDLTDSEAQEFDGAMREQEAVLADIRRREQLEVVNQHLVSPAPNGAANGHANGNGTQAQPAAQRPAPQPVRGHRVQVENRAAGTFGFRDFGEFAQAVRNAGIHGRPTDPRLLNSAGPPDNVMTEGVNADGGYAVPPDFRTDIQSLLMAEDSLLPLTDNITTSSNRVIVPIDSSTPWDTVAGIQAYWDKECALKKNSKLALDQVTVSLNKLYVLVPVSDELLEDAPALAALLRRKAPEKMEYKINDAILNGTGTGEPQGIYTSPAAVTVPRDAAQAAGTITVANIFQMWTAFYSASRSGVWITSQEGQAALLSLYFPIPTGGVGNTITGFPAYLPPGGLSAAPYGTLMGRPILVTDVAPALGTAGDIALVDLKSYLTATKTGGIKQDISIHLWFDYDITCFRFVIRVGGTPWFKAPITTKSGGQRSPYVLLGADVVTPPGNGVTKAHYENAQQRQQAQAEAGTQRPQPPIEGAAPAGEHPTVTSARRSNERAEEAAAQRRREGR
jgi:HK97 family phage major capsid protein